MVHSCDVRPISIFHINLTSGSYKPSLMQYPLDKEVKIIISEGQIQGTRLQRGNCIVKTSPLG
jgi:hypothetical protein